MLIKKIKNNILLILSFLILLTVVIIQSVKYINNDLKLVEMDNKLLIQCQQGDFYKDKKDFCETVIKEHYTGADTFTTFSGIMHDSFDSITLILFLFIVSPSLVYICNYLKCGMIKNDLTRSSYKKIKWKLILKSYKSLFIFPIITIIVFLISFIYGGSLDASSGLNYSTVPWNSTTLSMPILFIIFYVFNVFIHSFLYINIAISTARKKHNYFIAVILSFLIFIAIEAFLEITFNVLIFSTLLKSDAGIMFNIANFIAYNDNFGIITPMIVPFILALISFIVVLIKYKNKEKLVIDCE